MPPVLFPSEKPLAGDVRACLLLAFTVHLAAIPYLATVPFGPLTIPLAFFLGVSVLWSVPGLLAFQVALYAINAVGLLLAAWAFWGARHGEHVLFAAGAIPFLAAAIPMGVACYRLGGPGNTPSQGASPPAAFAFGTWGLAAASLAILAAGLGVLAFRKGEGERSAIPAGEGRTSPPAILDGGHSLNDRPDSIWRETEARLKMSATRREEEMRRLALMSPEGMFVNDSEAPASFIGEFNRFGGRRYFGNRTYSWEVGVAGERHLPFSCRRRMLRNLVPRWVHSLLGPGEESRSVAQGVLGDSLFRSFRCREFPDSAAAYFAQVDGHSRTATWKAMRPGYGIRILRRVAEMETVWPGLRVEFHPDRAVAAPSQTGAPVDPEGIGDLFMVSDVPPGGDPFPYARLTFALELPLKRGGRFEAPGYHTGSAADSAISFDLAGFDSLLVKRVWIEASFDMDDDTDYREVTFAVLKCRTREGDELVLAKSERLPGEDPTLGVRINEVVVADVNGDGDPDFLVQGNYLPERLIVTRKGVIQADMPLFPGRAQ